MKVRCDLQLNGGHRKLVLVTQEHETLEHVALRLSAYLLFWDLEPSLELSLKHPALVDQEFQPDLIALEDDGRIRLWVECGKVATHKLDKLTRRYAGATLVALKATEREGQRLRGDIEHQLDRHRLLQIWSWKAEDFAVWSKAIHDNTYVIGEASGRSLNLVINDVPIAADLVAY